MRSSFPVWVLALCAALFFLPPPLVRGEGNEVEVEGKGHAAAGRPPDSTSPPPHYRDADHEHDPAEGVELSDTGTFEVRKDGKAVPPQQNADSDRLYWKVNGATLTATGRVRNTSNSKLVQLKSSAWGDKIIPVTVSQSEGQYGWIWAHNRIQFKYAYTVSGAKIAEAGLMLEGNAYDIYGKQHTFNVSEQSGESISENAEEKAGFSLSSGDERGAALRIGGKKSGFTVGGTAQEESTANWQIAATLTRRFGKSAGAAGATIALLIKHQMEGDTPLSKTYEVFSDGFVELVARSGQEGLPVLVDLSYFTVFNSLRAWKSHGVRPDPTPPGIPPSDPGGGPTTPGDAPPSPPPPAPPPPPGDPGPGPTTPRDRGGKVQLYGEEWISPGEDPPQPVPSDEPDPPSTAGEEADTAGLKLVVKPPHGLTTEPGTLPGQVLVRMREPASRELRFTADTVPSGGVVWEGSGEVTIPKGERFQVVRIRALRAESVLVRFTRLGPDGAPTGQILEAPLETKSTASYPNTRLLLSVPSQSWGPGLGGGIRAVAGEDAGPLHIARLGFAGWAEEATTVTILTEDPDGILGAVPAEITIAAGEEAASLPLPLAAHEGTGRLRLRQGAEEIEIVVVSRRPRWDRPGTPRIPVGSIAPIPFFLLAPTHKARMVDLVIEADACIELAEPEKEKKMHRGERAWFASIRALRLGQATATLLGDGLEPLEVSVEVVPARISCMGGVLRLADLHEAHSGVVQITAPEGCTFLLATLQPGTEEMLTLSGQGTPSLELELRLDVGIPEIVEIPFTLEGTLPPGSRLQITEAIYDTDLDFTRVSYRIAIQ